MCVPHGPLSEMTLTIHRARIVTPTAVTSPTSIVVSDEGRVDFVGPRRLPPPVGGPCLDLRGHMVAPGFIDLHVHGGFGIQFARLGHIAEDLRAYSQRVVKTSVTGFLCTVAAPDAFTLSRVVQKYADVLHGVLRCEGTEPLFGGPLWCARWLPL
jgi:N-acetylglucosamine-6-phosphate deacetylase